MTQRSQRYVGKIVHFVSELVRGRHLLAIAMRGLEGQANPVDLTLKAPLEYGAASLRLRLAEDVWVLGRSNSTPAHRISR